MRAALCFLRPQHLKRWRGHHSSIGGGVLRRRELKRVTIWVGEGGASLHRTVLALDDESKRAALFSRSVDTQINAASSGERVGERAYQKLSSTERVFFTPCVTIKQPSHRVGTTAVRSYPRANSSIVNSRA